MRKVHLDNLGGKKLSKREYEIIRLIASGFTDRQIAERLEILENTVKAHRFHLVRKLKAKNSAHAVSLAFKKGILKWGA